MEILFKMFQVKYKLWIFYLLTACSSIYADNRINDICRDSVDLIEINHFYDEQGRLVFDQLIFSDWNEDHLNSAERFGLYPRYNIRAWRLVRNPNQLPTKDWSTNIYYSFWTDGELLRYITTKSIVETWTQYDPELLEREFLPKENRKELRNIQIKKKKTESSTGNM